MDAQKAIEATLERLIAGECIGSVDEILYRLAEAHPDITERQILAAMDAWEARI